MQVAFRTRNCSVPDLLRAGSDNEHGLYPVDTLEYVEDQYRMQQYMGIDFDFWGCC